MTAWYTECERQYRPDISKIYCEKEGHYSFPAPGGTFTLSARADRIDLTREGTLNIIDYKTGNARTAKEVAGGYAPQLPIEGIIAQNGGFEGITGAEIKSLRYWQLGKKETVIDKNVKEILDHNLENIKRLISVFDYPDKPSLTQPNPKFAPAYSDYEHLSRIKEWGIVDGNDE